MKAITNNILVQNGNICKPKSKKDVIVTKHCGNSKGTYSNIGALWL